MGLGINYVIRANHLLSLITNSTTDPRLSHSYVLQNSWMPLKIFQYHDVTFSFFK